MSVFCTSLTESKIIQTLHYINITVHSIYRYTEYITIEFIRNGKDMTKIQTVHTQIKFPMNVKYRDRPLVQK